MLCKKCGNTNHFIDHHLISALVRQEDEHTFIEQTDDHQKYVPICGECKSDEVIVQYQAPPLTPMLRQDFGQGRGWVLFDVDDLGIQTWRFFSLAKGKWVEGIVMDNEVLGVFGLTEDFQEKKRFFLMGLSQGLIRQPARYLPDLLN